MTTNQTIETDVGFEPIASRPSMLVGSGPTASDIVAMLKRRTLMIVSLFILFALITVGGFMAWWRYLPGFRSECFVECISNIPESELAADQPQLRQDEFERFVLTQARLLKSPSVLADALKITAVRDTQWYKSLDPDETLLELSDSLAAAPIPGTNMLRVALTCRKREDPRVIVQAVVDQWLVSVRRRSAEQFAEKSIEGATNELEVVEGAIRRKRQNLRSVASRLPAGATLNPADNIVSQDVKQYGEQVAQHTLELSQLEQFRQLYADPNSIALTAEDRALVEQDPQISQLSQSIFLLEQQLSSDKKVLGANHEEIKRLTSQLDASVEQIDQLRQARLIERRAELKEEANTAWANTQHALLESRENLEKAEARLHDQADLLRQYQDLEDDIKQYLDNRLELVNYKRARQRVIRQQSAVHINIAQPAIDPLEQTSPSLLLLPMGMFLSVFLSISIALAVELLDKSMRTPQDMLRHLNWPLLGSVPHTDDEEVDVLKVATAVHDIPHSLMAESFRRLRTNLQYSAPPEEQKTILIASAQPEDGRSTVAGNLAIALAQSGRKILLIDANLRRPAIHQIFGQAMRSGLSDLLIGEQTLEQCVVPTDMANLSYLSAGRLPPNPAELLDSEPWRKCLREATSQYDQVIIDSAPILVASDALVVATSVDGVILVVRAKINSRGIAKRASLLLEDVGARVFGTVLNAVQSTRGGYFREELRRYYDYQIDTEKDITPGQ